MGRALGCARTCGMARGHTRTATLRNPVKAAAATPANSLMLFSTAPGHAALDGPAGQNSPFAAALLRQLGGVLLLGG